MDRALRVLAADAAVAAGRDRGSPGSGSGQAAAVRFGPDAVAADRLEAWPATMAMEGLSPTLFAGPLGPVAIAVRAVLLSLPVWLAWLWLVRRG